MLLVGSMELSNSSKIASYFEEEHMFLTNKTRVLKNNFITQLIAHLKSFRSRNLEHSVVILCVFFSVFLNEVLPNRVLLCRVTF